jgi:hypothetical protein
MSTSLTSAFASFFQSLTGIGISLSMAILAVFQAILSLFQKLLQSVIELFQAFIKLGLGVFQGMFGFVTANFLALAVIGGGYYWYTTSQGRRGRVARKAGK